MSEIDWTCVTTGSLLANKEPVVTHVQSISDTFKRLNRDLNAGDPAFYRVPDTRELAAQYLLLYELSLPFGLDLNNQLDISKSSTQVICLLYTSDAADE